MAIADKINALAGTNAGGSIEDALDNLINNGGGSSSNGSAQELLILRQDLDENGKPLHTYSANYTPSEYHSMVIERKMQPRAVLMAGDDSLLRYEFAKAFIFEEQVEDLPEEKRINIAFDTVPIVGSILTDGWELYVPAN
jgi:hypothetical protein